MTESKYNDKDEPNRVYIQNYGSDEPTWCVDRIMDADDDCPDIEYVHIDIVNELLDACEDLLQFNIDDSGDSPTLDKYRAIIAKARGEQ